MLRPRIIASLLIHKSGLVKTVNFANPRYIGDPINAVRIFNEQKADELLVTDIDASVNGQKPNFKLISKLAAECRMPLCYGGGITEVDEATRLVDMGVEKVAISSAAIENPNLITKMAASVGSQSVVAVLDIRKRKGLFSQGYEILTNNAKLIHKADPINTAIDMQNLGAGEILINSIDRDGMMQGYDLDMASNFRKAIKVPITFLGGAGSLEDMKILFKKVGTVGAAAGSLFVFKGKYRAVLINYPSISERMLISQHTLDH